VGGGFEFDPGGKPDKHAQSCGNGYIARSYGEAAVGYNAGPFSFKKGWTGYSGNAFVDKVNGEFIDSPPNATLNLQPNFGLGGGASMKFEFGSYSNWR
ncbi:hypothetical protein QN379_04595, partial [Glaciimonas sp. Gout2]|uniref:hypothetical protein n=1 Tax=Glaciimonas sp. Gout2 TaxID=3048625 RepID=UPI002B23B22F